MSIATTIPGLLNATEAAEYLGISSSLVRQYCRKGRIHGERVGNNWVVKISELNRFQSKPRPIGNPNFIKK